MHTVDTKETDSAWLERARELIAQVDMDDEAGLRKVVDDLARVRETEMFHEIGKLTRELHDALNAFRFDARLEEFASQEIPDATERLNHVIHLTEQSAHRTLASVETSLPCVESLGGRARELGMRWQRFRARDMSADEFRELARELDAFLPKVGDDTEAIRGQLSEILMAQDFQDLTGQVIRRVITLVQDLEQHLITMLRLSGNRLNEPADASATEPQMPSSSAVQGPVVPGVDGGDVVRGQDDVDDLLSSLGF